MKIKNNLCVATALLLFTGTANAQDYISPAENVAVNKPATASTGTASLAFDDDEGTRWESSHIDGQWIYIDLENDYAIDQIQLVWEGAYAKQYKIYVASQLSDAMSSELSDEDLTNDFTNSGWTVAATVDFEISTGFPYTYNLDLETETHGRYVALQTIERGTNYGTSLWEFRVKSFGEYNAAGSTDAERIQVGVSPTEIYSDETATLSSAVINGQNFRIADAQVSYTSDPEGLTFDGNTVSGTMSGTYTITAASGNVSDTCSLTIRETAVLASLNIAAGNTEGSTADTYAFTVSATNQYGDTFTGSYETQWQATAIGGSGQLVSSDNNTLTFNSRGEYDVCLKSGEITSNTVRISVKAEGENIITEATATATDGTENPQNAIDGDLSTQWIIPEGLELTEDGNYATSQELIIDLGSEKTFNCIHSYWEGASAVDYTVTFSTDGSEYTGASANYSITDGTGGAGANRHDWLEGEDVTAKYIKISVTKPFNNSWGVKLFEVQAFNNSARTLTDISISADVCGFYTTSETKEVSLSVSGIDQFGSQMSITETTTWYVNDIETALTDNIYAIEDNTVSAYEIYCKIGELESNTICIAVVDPTMNLAQNKSIVFYSDGSQSPGNAIDGNSGTSWIAPRPESAVQGTGTGETTTWYYDAEIVIDLGSTFNVNCVHTLWEQASAADYTVTFSTDNRNWSEATEAFTVTDGVGMAGDRNDWLAQTTAIEARYVKVHTTRAATNYAINLKELEIYTFEEIVPELAEIRITADKTIGHVNDSYTFTVQMLDQLGNDYTTESDGLWLVENGEMTGNVFKASDKGTYQIAYEADNMTSNTVEINIVASGDNLVPISGLIVSQTEGADRGAENAIDGNDNTDWFIKDADNAQEFEAEFIYRFNLLTAVNVDAICLHFEGASSCKYDVYYSTTGNENDWILWEPYDNSENPVSGERYDWLYKDETIQMEYIKFVSHQVINGSWGLRLFEMKAYGEDNDDATTAIKNISNTNVGKIFMVGETIVMPATMSNVKVYNMAGVMVVTATYVSSMDASALENGVYIVTAIDGENNIYTAKVIK